MDKCGQLKLVINDGQVTINDGQLKLVINDGQVAINDGQLKLVINDGQEERSYIYKLQNCRLKTNFLGKILSLLNLLYYLIYFPVYREGCLILVYIVHITYIYI